MKLNLYWYIKLKIYFYLLFIIYPILIVCITNELKKNNDEFLVVLSGSLTIKVINGNLDEIFILNKPNIGLYISRKLESNFIKFSQNAILLVLRSGSNEK